MEQSDRGFPQAAFTPMDLDASFEVDEFYLAK